MPEFRGKGFGLLLMREVKHVLALTSSLILLKAHPDGREVSDADCRRLAKHYQSDERLGPKAISKPPASRLAASAWN